LSELGIKQRSVIVALHNRLRSRVRPMAANMQKMEWDGRMAILAEKLAMQCGAEPSPQNGPFSCHIGWNMHLSTHRIASFSDIIHAWFEEGNDFLFLSGKCRENATCQHYTQLVWATSSHVGCASQLCLRDGGIWEIFVCVNGKLVRPYKLGLSCSLCTSSMSGCFRLWDHVGGLCEIPKNPCRMSCGQQGHFNVSFCKCKWDPVFTGRFCQVRCSVQGVHGRFKEEQCSCLCHVGFGGRRCPFPSTAVI
uniref:C-type lectin domain family 18 member A n=1 Tax=Oryzias latipes TaxID=8090 RepID=A0A3P9IW14_ORYLA